MGLSKDLKTLHKVYVGDIVDGTFIIPTSVTQIDPGAFRGCHALTRITIPPSVTWIGVLAFIDCRALTEITMLASVTEIGLKTFEDCHALTEITIPASVTKIDGGAFANCSALKKIIIPAGVTKIGRYAFHNCHALTQIIINTNSDEVVDRLKSLLPPEYAGLAVKRSIYNKRIEHDKKLCQIFVDAMLGEYKSFYALLIHHILRFNKNCLNLPNELTNWIASFDEESHKNFKNRMNVLALPTNEQELESYISMSLELFKIAVDSDDTIGKEAEQLLSQENMEEISCKAKLTNYCLYIEKQKEIKRKKQPTFFIDNETLSLEIEAKLKAVKKVIEYLGENKLNHFTLEDMKYLEKGFIGDCLNEYNISLPQADQSTYTFEVFFNFLIQSVETLGRAALDLMHAISTFITNAFCSSSQGYTPNT